MSGVPPEDVSAYCQEEGQEHLELDGRKPFRRRRRGHRKAGGNSGAPVSPPPATHGCQSEELELEDEPASILEAFGFAPQRPCAAGATKPVVGIVQEGCLAERRLTQNRSPAAGMCRNVVTWSDLGGPAESGRTARTTPGVVPDAAGRSSTFAVRGEVHDALRNWQLRALAERDHFASLELHSNCSTTASSVEQETDINALLAWHSMAQAERTARDKIGQSQQVLGYDPPCNVPSGTFSDQTCNVPSGTFSGIGTLSDMCWQPDPRVVSDQWAQEYTEEKRQWPYQGVDEGGVLLPSSADLEVMLKSMASGVYED